MSLITPTPPAPCFIISTSFDVGREDLPGVLGHSYADARRRPEIPARYTGWPNIQEAARCRLPAWPGISRPRCLGQACFCEGRGQKHLRHWLLFADEHRCAPPWFISKNGLLTTIAAGRRRTDSVMPWRAACLSAARLSSGCGTQSCGSIAEAADSRNITRRKAGG